MKPFILVSFLMLAFAPRTIAQTAQDKPYTFIVSIWPKGDNSPRLPRKKTQDTSLQAAITDALRTSKIQAYSDSTFARILSVGQINNIVRMTQAYDTLYYNLPDGTFVVSYIGEEFDFYGLTDYRILARGESSMQLIGIGIFRQKHKAVAAAKKGNLLNFPATEVLMWLRYKDAKPILDQYNATHPDNKFIARRG